MKYSVLKDKVLKPFSQMNPLKCPKNEVWTLSKVVTVQTCGIHQEIVCVRCFPLEILCLVLDGWHLGRASRRQDMT